jgi:hypothetical protein
VHPKTQRQPEADTAGDRDMQQHRRDEQRRLEQEERAYKEALHKWELRERWVGLVDSCVFMSLLRARQSPTSSFFAGVVLSGIVCASWSARLTASGT